MDFSLSTYYPVFIYFVVVVGFAVTNVILTQIIGPKRRTPVKLMPYESGMDPIGDARQHFDVKYYLMAVLFLLFDVELLFLYPWAVSAYQRPEGASEPLVPTARESMRVRRPKPAPASTTVQPGLTAWPSSSISPVAYSP